MPHLIIEYTANLAERAQIPELLKNANRVLGSLQDDGSPVFPMGAIRSRAIELEHYFVADGSADDAFVHATLKIGAGRSAKVKQAASTALFEMIKEHFATLYAERFLALSLELFEFGEEGTLKQNNIHARYAAR